MLATVSSSARGITLSPQGNHGAAFRVASSRGILLSLFPAQAELVRLVQGRNYRLEQVLREPLMIANMSDQTVDVELKALSLSEAGIRPEAGCADLLGPGRVAISPATFSLKPGEERPVEGTLTLLKRGPKGKALMCVIAATVVNQGTKAQTFSRVYVNPR